MFPRDTRMTPAALTIPVVRVAATLGCLLLATGSVAGGPPVKVTAARVGLPPAGRVADEADIHAGHVSKFATWTPVYVDLELVAEVKEPAELVIETPDADGVMTTLAVPLDLARTPPGSSLLARELRSFPYLRPAAGGGETTITVRTSGGGALSEPFRIRSLRPKPASTYVVLGLGSALPGFDLPKPAAAGDAAPATDTLRGGRIERATITDIGLLPDQWFGYDTADLVVLSTTSGEFFESLFGATASASAKTKRAALLEWVRRGGRIVVTVGANAPLVSRTPAIHELLPAVIDASSPTRTPAQIALFWSARETSQTSTLGGNLSGKGGSLTLANLMPGSGRGGRTVIPPPSRRGDDKSAVAVQSGYGLGRVTLIGFDLDRPPFTEFTLRAEFWDWVLREGGASRASVGSEGKARVASATPTDDEDEIAAALRTHVDTFESVPVVSFGWIAVLIALYILLIGPVEYYLLKRVLGRLELTWVTFPVIVATVCAAACFAAYALKGRDLRVNKVDVIDVVAENGPAGSRGGRVFGTTWFTVFSPKIDTYTVGVSPAEGWLVSGQTGDSLVGWVGGPRGGRAGLLRRRYQYHTDVTSDRVADGLIGVPIQVWSTKSFTANWAGTFDPAAPVLESRLEHPPGDPGRAIGTFVNRMPFPAVTDCVAFYSGQAYPLGTIVNGQEVRLVLDKGVPAAQWLQENGQLADLLARAPPGDAVAGRSAVPTPAAYGRGLPLWGLLFHEASLRNDEGVIARNASFRRLDQSWRLVTDNRDEVVVAGRVLPPSDDADMLFNGPASPSRVWLKALPEAGTRPEMRGLGRQETYVRLYLPVAPAAPAGHP